MPPPIPATLLKAVIFPSSRHHPPPPPSPFILGKQQHKPSRSTLPTAAPPRISAHARNAFLIKVSGAGGGKGWWMRPASARAPVAAPGDGSRRWAGGGLRRGESGSDKAGGTAAQSHVAGSIQQHRSEEGEAELGGGYQPPPPPPPLTRLITLPTVLTLGRVAAVPLLMITPLKRLHEFCGSGVGGGGNSSLSIHIFIETESSIKYTKFAFVIERFCPDEDGASSSIEDDHGSQRQLSALCTRSLLCELHDQDGEHKPLHWLGEGGTWELQGAELNSKSGVQPLAFCMNGWWATTATTGIFLAASITDWLDGYIARKMRLRTSFGAFLDPVADKLMVATALVLLCSRPLEAGVVGEVPWLLTVPSIAIIGREITMSAVREWAASQNSKVLEAVAVNNLGKWKTATQMTALTILLATRDPSLIGGTGVLIPTGVVLLYTSAGLGVWSLAVYVRKIWGIVIK